jgi:MFS superfamily sulfate permease-like transporter
MVIGILASHFGEFASRWGVAVTGDLATGFPSPTVPDGSLMKELLVDSIIVAIVGYSITLSLAKIFAERFHYQMDGNQELLAEVRTSMI